MLLPSTVRTRAGRFVVQHGNRSDNAAPVGGISVMIRVVSTPRVSVTSERSTGARRRLTHCPKRDARRPYSNSNIVAVCTDFRTRAVSAAAFRVVERHVGEFDRALRGRAFFVNGPTDAERRQGSEVAPAVEQVVREQLRVLRCGLRTDEEKLFTAVSDDGVGLARV